MWRRDQSCAPHMGDTSGNVYDTNGKVCVTITKQDWYYIGAAIAFCVTTLSVIGIVLLVKRLRAKRRQRAARLASDDAMSSMASPLIGVNQYMANQSFQQSPHSSTTSHFPNSPQSPFSPVSENFYFPVLSADGHLLPVPAPSHNSQSSASVKNYERPLPAPPSPVMSHAPPATRHNYSPVVGIHPEMSAYPVTRPALPNVPRIEQSWGLYQPQTATYHRSFSAEGERMNV